MTLKEDTDCTDLHGWNNLIPFSVCSVFSGQPTRKYEL